MAKEKVKIIDSIWINQLGAPSFGMVISENFVKERNAFIGMGKGFDQKEDEQIIADFGQKVDALHWINFLKKAEKTCKVKK